MRQRAIYLLLVIFILGRILLYLDKPIASVFLVLEPIICFFSISLFLIYLWRKGSVHLLFLASSLLLFPSIQHTFSLGVTNGGEGDFSVISMNVHVFNRYEASNQGEHKETHRMIDWLLESSPDILCLQEYVNNDHSNHFRTNKAFEAVYPYAAYGSTLADNAGTTYGVITFSKWPIINKGVLKISTSTNQVAFADLKIKEDTIRVYNIHFQSYKLESHELKKVTELKNLKSLAKKIIGGTSSRSKQVEQVCGHIEQSPFPVLICGDFNDMPYSETYISFNDRYQDAFVRSGDLFGATFHHENLPDMRIDYHFYDKGLECIGLKVQDQMHLSDHYPLLGRYLIE